MSRIGRLPIQIAAGVKVTVDGAAVSVEGPKGTLQQRLPQGITAALDGEQLVVRRQQDTKSQKALHGLSRALLANAVQGVTEGYQKTLEIMGVGYRAQQAGPGVVLSVGYSHTVEIKPPQDITITVEGNNRIHVQGVDKQKVGEIAAQIRRVRRPNPYKEKGIKYSDEQLRFKPGKAAARKA